MKKNRYSIYNNSIRGKYRELRRAAKNTGYAFNIDLHSFASLQANDCFYCGDDLPKSGSGIDRINSKKGYVLGNVAPCCRRCNVAKSDMSKEQFYKYIKKVAAKLGII